MKVGDLVWSNHPVVKTGVIIREAPAAIAAGLAFPKHTKNKMCWEVLFGNKLFYFEPHKLKVISESR